MKRDEIKEMIRELNEDMVNGVSEYSHDQYTSELKRLRFKYVIDYDRE